MYSIAIDGPTGAGKSTVSRALAKKLGFIYVDTGALYRAIGYTALTSCIDVYNESEVEELLKDMSVTIEYVALEQHVFANSKDVTEYLRTEQVSMAASAVSAHPSVRAFLLDLQRNLAKTQNVVMDGRDIATVVLPNADVKIFLTASAEERAGRRLQELLAKGIKAEYTDVLEDLTKRDYNDSNRAVAPLKVAQGATVVDSTEMSFEMVVEYLLILVREKLNI